MSPKNSFHNWWNMRHSSLRMTLFYESFTLLVLTVFAVSVVAFFLSWHEFKNRTTAQLQSIAESKEALLESTVSGQREQLSILGRDPELSSLPSVTALVGFRQLLRVDATGNVAVLAGEQDSSLLTKELLLTLQEREGTIFRPIVTDAGWTMYIVTAPQISGTVRIGTLVTIFDATGLASSLLNTDSATKTMEVLLATTIDKEDIVLRVDDTTKRLVTVRDTANGRSSVVHDALAGKEGISDTVDYSGISVLAAYRSIPTLGWAVIAKVDRAEVQASTIRLAINLVATGLIIIVFLSLSTFFSGRRIVGPLEELTEKLDKLETKHWQFKRSIFTGNELEIVDVTADELTKRLFKAHEHLESIVAERTQELQKQHAEDAAILQSMDDGLVVTDATGVITYVNQMAEILTGRNEALGKTAEQFLAIADKDGNVLNPKTHPVVKVLSTRTTFHPSIDPRLTLKKPDGTQTAIQIRVTPILRGKQSIGSVTVIRDVTEERSIDRMKSEFISLVSHQLRTPLSSMRWYLEMLMAEDAGPLSTDQRDYVNQVSTSNARMVHLVNALLNVSKIELGKFQLNSESFDLPKLVSSTAASFDLDLKQKKITFTLDLPKQAIEICSDKSLLVLIIENLLSNAVKYSHPESSISVKVSEDGPTGTAILTVQDNGIGIPELQKDQIGHKLFRGNNAKMSDTDGNGLGLYISKIAIETIGAKLTFESTEDKGTTFSLVIPLHPKSH